MPIIDVTGLHARSRVMTYDGSRTGSLDPFGGAQHIGAPPGQGPGFPHAQGPPVGQTKTLATLSIVLAFVFAPVGAVLGRLALSQIKWGKQRDRDRAMLGVTLSYVFIVLALVGWCCGPVPALMAPHRGGLVRSRGGTDAAVTDCEYANDGDPLAPPSTTTATICRSRHGRASWNTLIPRASAR
jgi:hypothetical protein